MVEKNPLHKNAFIKLFLPNKKLFTYATSPKFFSFKCFLKNTKLKYLLITINNNDPELVEMYGNRM